MGNLEFFTENIKLPVTANESNNDDVAIRDIIQLRHPGVWPQRHRLIFNPLNKLIGRFSPKATITMMLIVEPLKIFALPLQIRITLKPLSAKKLFVISIVKVFYDTITPWFTNRDKNGLNTKIETCF